MAFEGDSASFEETVIDQNEQMIRLLKAILMGIEIIANEENLIDDIED